MRVFIDNLTLASAVKLLCLPESSTLVLFGTEYVHFNEVSLKRKKKLKLADMQIRHSW